jgi:CNT family concentrative nucleoside transporter
MERLTSAFGMLVMMALAFALCPPALRKRVNWRAVGLGLLITVVAAVLVLKTPVRALFAGANDAVEFLIAICDRGATFVFGSLVDPKGPAGFVFAFKILPTIVFFAALFSLLYYFRVLPFLVTVMGRALSRVLGTSGAESFSTVADIFVGQTEAPLVIRPYIEFLTMSELLACMTAGFATTAGGVLASYVGMLSETVPDIAGHLIACSVMCAPASLVIAKLIYPETEQPQTAGDTPIEIPASSGNVLEAVAVGTTDGLKLAVNVGAMLIVFTAFTHLLNAALGRIYPGLSLERILGAVFYPLAWVMGVPGGDVEHLATLLGQKTVLNEFVAYLHMGTMLKQDGTWLSERGRLIASYALCGFANFASIGIQIGGYSGLAPSRRGDLSKLALRAMIGGLLTTCLVASLAGVLA